MLSQGQTLGNWQVERSIGAGAMAEVYLVKHITFDQLRALKVLTLRHPELDDRLIKEGYVQANLDHPNVVRVYDLLRVGDSWGLLMEYVDGRRLDEWLHDAPRSLEEREAVFRDIVSAVSAAHQLGYVHRDLKPQNVMMARGDRWVPKVADFGMVKFLDALPGAEGTRSGRTMGTPGYMAPEQINDAASADRRADIYALGCILYQVCCGTPPFSGDYGQVVQAHFSGSWLPPRQLIPELPDRFVEAIQGALTVYPDDRFPSCEAMLAVLDGASAPGFATLAPEGGRSLQGEAPRVDAAGTDTWMPHIAEGSALDEFATQDDLVSEAIPATPGTLPPQSPASTANTASTAPDAAPSAAPTPPTLSPAPSVGAPSVSPPEPSVTSPAVTSPAPAVTSSAQPSAQREPAAASKGGAMKFGVAAALLLVLGGGGYAMLTGGSGGTEVDRVTVPEFPSEDGDAEDVGDEGTDEGAKGGEAGSGEDAGSARGDEAGDESTGGAENAGQDASDGDDAGSGAGGDANGAGDEASGAGDVDAPGMGAGGIVAPGNTIDITGEDAILTVHGITAVLRDAAGKDWPTGAVPPGQYQVVRTKDGTVWHTVTLMGGQKSALTCSLMKGPGNCSLK